MSKEMYLEGINECFSRSRKQIQPGVTEEKNLAFYETAVPNSTKKTVAFGLVVFTNTVCYRRNFRKPTQNYLFTVAIYNNLDKAT